MVSSCAWGTCWTSLLIQDASIVPTAVGQDCSLCPFHSCYHLSPDHLFPHSWPPGAWRPSPLQTCSSVPWLCPPWQATQIPPEVSPWPQPLTTLCCSQFSSTHHLSSWMWAEISSLLSKTCSLPSAHFSSRCILCSSSSMTHDVAFYYHHCNLLLLPNPQPAFPSLCVTTQVLPAVSSLADVGSCHPKANPPGSSSVGQAAHWKGAPGLHLSLGKPVLSSALQERERI